MPISKKFDQKEFLAVLSRRLKFIVIAVLTCTLVGAILFVVTPKKFKSTTTILIIPQRVPESYVRSTVSLRIEDRLASMRLQIMSRTSLLSLIDELKLFNRKTDKRNDEELVEQVRRQIDLQVRGHDSFVLSFTHENSQVAMLTTSRLASYFIDENLRLREQQAVGTSDFLESQLQETKAKLETQENIVKEYRTRNMGQLPQQLDTNMAALSRAQEQFRSVSDTLRSAEDRKLFYESQMNSLTRPHRPAGQGIIAATSATAGGAAEGPVAPAGDYDLVREIRTKQARLAELSSKYTDNYPEIKTLKMDLSRLEKSIAASQPPTANRSDSRQNANSPAAATVEPRRDAASGIELQRYQQDALRYEQEAQRLSNGISSTELEITSLKKKLKDVEKSLSDFQDKIDSAPKREQELYSINRDYENLKLSYNDLLRKKLDAQVSANLEKQQKGAQFQIVDPPNLPETPVSPQVKVFFMATILSSLVFGIGGAFFIEFLDKTIQKASLFENHFEIPVLVSLPILPDPRTVRRKWVNDVAFFVTSSVIFLMILVALYYATVNNA